MVKINGTGIMVCIILATQTSKFKLLLMLKLLYNICRVPGFIFSLYINSYILNYYRISSIKSMFSVK